MKEHTEDSLLEDIGRLSDTIKYCQLRISKCALMVAAMERKRRGLEVPEEVSNIISLFKADEKQRAKYYAVNIPVNDFLEKVGNETFKIADVIRFAGPDHHPNTVGRVIQNEAKSGRLVKERHGCYRAVVA